MQKNNSDKKSNHCLSLTLKNKSIRYVIAFLIYLAAFFLFSYNYADPDLWGHIKFGEEIYNSKSFVRYDRYSYTPGLKTWLNHEWLSEVIFYLIYRFLGSFGLVLFKIIIGLLITFMLWKMILARTNFPWEVVPVLLILSISVISFGFAIRPQIFTYLFFTIFIYGFYSFKQGKKTLLLLLPILMILWTNLHGGFLAGIGLLFIYLVAEFASKSRVFKKGFQHPIDNLKLKVLLAIFSLSILTTLINPYFINLWSFLFKTLPQSRPHIWEWLPANLDLLLIDNVLHYFILLLVSIFLIFTSRAKIPFSELCLFLSTLILSLKHTRHIPFFGIVAISILPSYLEHLILTKKRKLISLLNKINIIFLCIVSASLIYEGVFKRGRDFFKIRIEKYYYPIREVQFIKENNFEGNLLADFDWGEYCIWKLYPRCKIFIDGRYKTVYPREIINEFFNFLYAKKGWEDFLGKYPHHWILIGKFHPVAKFLYTHKDWMMVYNLEDSPAILLVKKNTLGYRQLLYKFKTGDVSYPKSDLTHFFP